MKTNIINPYTSQIFTQKEPCVKIVFINKFKLIFMNIFNILESMEIRILEEAKSFL